MEKKNKFSEKIRKKFSCFQKVFNPGCRFSTLMAGIFAFSGAKTESLQFVNNLQRIDSREKHPLPCSGANFPTVFSLFSSFHFIPMKAQIFNDGNKRTAVIFANHYIISKGKGLLVIPEKRVPEFKKLLVAYYENRDSGEIETFLRKQCWRTF